ncbi:MAG TPA: TonB family protein [Gemmatimonas sp.]|nr:TonB family protein [Gemmatimonas sp.]
MHPRVTASTAVSTAAHVALAAAIVVASATTTQFSEEDEIKAARFLYPLLQSAPAPRQESVNYLALSAPATVEAPGPVVSAFNDRPVTKPSPIDSVVDETLAAEKEQPQRPLSELEVDSAAMRDPDSEGPVYPPDMLEKGIQGVARMQFTVTAQGVVETASIRVIETTQQAFADAARAALPKMRFRPAWAGGRPVAQFVQQDFAFRIAPPGG